MLFGADFFGFDAVGALLHFFQPVIRQEVVGNGEEHGIPLIDVPASSPTSASANSLSFRAAVDLSQGHSVLVQGVVAGAAIPFREEIVCHECLPFQQALERSRGTGPLRPESWICSAAISTTRPNLLG